MKLKHNSIKTPNQIIKKKMEEEERLGREIKPYFQHRRRDERIERNNRRVKK
jgi:hypothetical protein